MATTPKDRVVGGTKGLKQARIVKATGNNIKKIRCPNKCGGLAHPIPDGKGGQVIHCYTCNLNFKFQSM